MNPVAELGKQLAEGLVMERDALLERLVTDYLGMPDWSLEELGASGRCVLLVATDGRHVFTIDWVPLIEFYPDIGMDTRDMTQVTLSQKYRVLYEKGDA